jgi:type I restriction enzyme, S subunit
VGLEYGALAQPTSIPGLNRNQAYSLKCPVPPLAEQQKIASILSKVDELIQKTDQVIEQTQRLKKGLMQELFTKGIGHSKFKKVRYAFRQYIEIPEEWGIVKVSEITESVVPGRNKPKRFSGNIPWITISDIEGMYVTDSKSGLRVTKEEVHENAGKIIPPGSVIMTCVGEFGIVGISTRDMVLNQQLHAFICSKDILPYFLAISLMLQKRYMYSVATTTTIPYMNKDNCESIPIILPPIPEQEKIITTLSSLESCIINHQKYRIGIENLKQGLMQKLLTGKIRVKV